MRGADVKNLLDPNGYLESVIRRALERPDPTGEKTQSEKLADEIIARLRGDDCGDSPGGRQ